MIAEKIINKIKGKNEEAVKNLKSVNDGKHFFMLKIPQPLWSDFEHLYINLKGTEGINSRESLILYLMEVATQND